MLCRCISVCSCLSLLCWFKSRATRTFGSFLFALALLFSHNFVLFVCCLLFFRSGIDWLLSRDLFVHTLVSTMCVFSSSSLGNAIIVFVCFVCASPVRPCHQFCCQFSCVEGILVRFPPCVLFRCANTTSKCLVTVCAITCRRTNCPSVSIALLLLCLGRPFSPIFVCSPI